tara:strand:- start:926 stop:1099 length:174 start_codon:yes stop_codon:yes gene_type:complete
MKKLILILSEIFSFFGPIAGRYYRFKNSDGDPISGGLKNRKKRSEKGFIILMKLPNL